MQRKLAWFLVLLWMSACDTPMDKPPPPGEPAPGTVGYYCGMTLEEHPGPKGQILLAEEAKPLWFSSVTDAFSYLRLEGATRRIAAFYVNDMGRAEWNRPQPGTWISAKSAYYSVGGKRTGGMGGVEIVPFATRNQAEAFTKQYGGRVQDYGQVVVSAH